MELHLAEIVKKLRKEKNLKQEDIASALGVTYQAVSRWENGLSYPDVELLPELAALFDVSMDVLFGYDTAREEVKKLQYQKKDAMIENTEEKIALVKEYIAMLPGSVYFKYRLLELYISCGIAFVQNKLPEMRKLCSYIVDHTNESDEIRLEALVIMIKAEDENNVSPWLSLLDRQSVFTSREILIGRYEYRRETDQYNRSIQAEIFTTLQYLFMNYFCRKGENHTYDPVYSAEGKKTILNMIDTLRDPEEDADAWLETRIYQYLKLAAGLFSCGKEEEGYVALDTCTALCRRYAAIPDGTILRFHTPVLEDIYQSSNAACFLRERILDALTSPSGWEWFDSVRHTERFQNSIRQIEECIQKRK